MKAFTILIALYFCLKAGAQIVAINQKLQKKEEFGAHSYLILCVCLTLAAWSLYLLTTL